jgi:hypothetical protein
MMSSTRRRASAICGTAISPVRSAMACVHDEIGRAVGLLAFRYCYVPEGQPVTLTRLVCAAGLRWPVAARAAYDIRLLHADQRLTT